MNVFPQYIADQRRVSRFSWSLYSAQTLDQLRCWRSKMCFQKFIIYILKYTHRKAPSKVFRRTWVLANQNREQGFFVRAKKNDTSNQIPQKCVDFAPKFPPFLALVDCSGLAEIQRESSFCETKIEWIFSLENLKQNLENLRAMVSYISNSTRKTVKSRENMQQQKWKTKGDVRPKFYLYRNFICFCLCSE